MTFAPIQVLERSMCNFCRRMRLPSKLERSLLITKMLELLLEQLAQKILLKQTIQQLMAS